MCHSRAVEKNRLTEFSSCGEFAKSGETGEILVIPVDLVMEVREDGGPIISRAITTVLGPQVIGLNTKECQLPDGLDRNQVFFGT